MSRLEEITIDECCGAAHQQKIQGKSRIGVGGKEAAGPQEKVHRRVHQCIQRIHPQQAGGHNRIVDDGLKHNRCAADSNGRNQHGKQFRRAQLHGKAQQALVAEIQLHRHVGDDGQRNQRTQDEKSGGVSAFDACIHTVTSLFFPNRIALRPCLSRYISMATNKMLPTIPMISSMGSS